MPYLTPDDAPTASRGIVVFVPDTDESIHTLLGLLDILRFPESWEQFGDATPEEIAARWLACNDDTATENLYP